MDAPTALLADSEIRAMTEALGPLSTFASVDSDGTPHIIPVIPAWIGDALVFGAHALSRKVKNVGLRSRASMQFLTPGEAFPDALLIKGTARVIDSDAERLARWDSGSFPFLPMMYSGADDVMLRFIEFTPHRAVLVKNGGRGPVQRWHVSAAGALAPAQEERP